VALAATFGAGASGPPAHVDRAIQSQVAIRRPATDALARRQLRWRGWGGVHLHGLAADDRSRPGGGCDGGSSGSFGVGCGSVGSGNGGGAGSGGWYSGSPADDGGTLDSMIGRECDGMSGLPGTWLDPRRFRADFP